MNSITKPKLKKQLASLENSVWYQWQVGSDLYRLADRNGIPTIEQWIRSDWYPVALSFEVDPVMAGIAQLAKRLNRAEKLIDILKSRLEGRS